MKKFILITTAITEILHAKIKFCIIFFFMIINVGISYAISSYDSGTNTIIVNSGINSIDDVYTDINNTNYLSRSGSTYILKVNMLIDSSATLSINGVTLIFNGPYRIWTKGALYINSSTITSADTTDISQRGWIMGRRWYYEESGYILQIRNSTLSYLGPDKLDENGEYTAGIFAYPPQTGDGTTRAPIILDNNDISHVSIVCGEHTYRDSITNNFIHDIKDETEGEYNTAIQIQDAVFENNTVTNVNSNYCVYTMGASTIRNNVISNYWGPVAGAAIRTKEGKGGALIENNIIHDGRGLSAINLGASERIYWDRIRNNEIYNFDGTGIYTVGNCYQNHVSVMEEISGNIIHDISGGYGGLHMSHTPYFTCTDSMTGAGAKDVLWKNNTIYNSNIGIYFEGEEYTNVFFIDNNFHDNTNDIVFSDGAPRPIAGNSPPFINNTYNKLEIPAGKYHDYKYLDVKVVDSCSNPISGATVVITNNTNINYPSININGTVKSSFITGADGHTLLPSDTANSAAILDFWKTSDTQQEMSYTISASLGSDNGSVTGVQPDITWYRTNPMIPTETIVITLSGSCSVTGVDQTEVEKNNIAIYPNPTKGKAIVEIDLKEREKVQISIYNILGEELATIANSEMSKGTHRLDISEYLSRVGVYIISVQAGNTSINRKLINVR